MLPGFLNGTYSEPEISIDVESLARRAGATLRLARAVRLDRSERRLELADGSRVPYDLVSFNLGSGPAGVELPGVRERALRLKPLGNAPAVRMALSDSAVGSRPATVVGGGAAGVEVACSIAAISPERPVRLVEASDVVLSGYGNRFRKRAFEVLSAKGVELRTGARVQSVESDSIDLAGGERLESSATVWLAGARAPEIFRASGLDTDRRGFLSIDDTLRHVADERIFGVGDCATLLQYPETPKAGVFSVRQGPVLWRGLVAAIRGMEPPTYRPQRDFLSLLNTADGKALASFRGLVSYGRLAWRLKDAIDRRFMRRYQP